MAVWSGPAGADTWPLTCDAFVIAADGSIGTTPIRTGVRGFTIVASATAPAEVRPGERFTVTIPSESLFLVSTADGFPVLSQRGFVRILAVTGATVVSGSVTQTPADAASSSTTDTAVTLSLASAVPGGDELTFPEARFDLVAALATTEVTVALTGFADTLDLENTDGSIVPIRTSCAAGPNLLSTTAVAGDPVVPPPTTPALAPEAAPAPLLPPTGAGPPYAVFAVVSICLGAGLVTFGRRPIKRPDVT